jgi:hypothetical protein
MISSFIRVHCKQQLDSKSSQHQIQIPAIEIHKLCIFKFKKKISQKNCNTFEKKMIIIIISYWKKKRRIIFVIE